MNIKRVLYASWFYPAHDVFKWKSTKISWFLVFRWMKEIFLHRHGPKLSVHIKLVEKNILISSHCHFVCSSFLLHLTFNISCMQTCVCARCVCVCQRIETKNHPTISVNRILCMQLCQRNVSILGAVERKTSCCFAFQLANGQWQTPSREWMECYSILGVPKYENS